VNVTLRRKSGGVVVATCIKNEKAGPLKKGKDNQIEDY